MQMYISGWLVGWVGGEEQVSLMKIQLKCEILCAFKENSEGWKRHW